MTDQVDLFDRPPEPPEPTRADQIFIAFAAFHEKNPQVWLLFKRFALESASVTDHYSSNAIFERIRWHIEIETTGKEVRLNNNFRAYYARLFHAAYPQHSGFFRNRKRLSEDGDSFADDIQVHNSGPPDAEDDLNWKLKKLLTSTNRRHEH